MYKHEKKCVLEMGYTGRRFPTKKFGSTDCDTIYIIYLSLCTQSADPNPIRGTHCMRTDNTDTRCKETYHLAFIHIA